MLHPAHSAVLQDSTELVSLFAIIQAAGWPIWFLLLASIVAVALIVERVLYLRRSRILPMSVLPAISSKQYAYNLKKTIA